MSVWLRVNLHEFYGFLASSRQYIRIRLGGLGIVVNLKLPGRQRVVF